MCRKEQLLAEIEVRFISVESSTPDKPAGMLCLLLEHLDVPLGWLPNVNSISPTSWSRRRTCLKKVNFIE